jgi:hypothetical protein
MEKDMQVINRWELQNPDGDFVKFAEIKEVERLDGKGSTFQAVVVTRYSYSRYGNANRDYFDTLLGAKQTIGRNFMPGGKWKQV